MTAEIENRARRILIIDDNRAIHENFHRILVDPEETSGWEDEECALLEKTDGSINDLRFELGSAFQGQEALRMFVDAWSDGKPYAMAFVNMNMPPGWDGIETISRLWQVDPFLHVVICTARSDCQWHDIVASLGRSDRLLILKKPFEAIEVQQLALMLTERWIVSLQEWCRLTEAEREASDAKRALIATQQKLYQVMRDGLCSAGPPRDSRLS